MPESSGRLPFPDDWEDIAQYNYVALLFSFPAGETGKNQWRFEEKSALIANVSELVYTK